MLIDGVGIVSLTDVLNFFWTGVLWFSISFGCSMCGGG